MPHPVDILDSALAAQPATIHDLLDALAPSALGPTHFTGNDTAAADSAASIKTQILASHSDAATELPGTSRGWHIRWSQHAWMIHGHLYLGGAVGGLVDETSPVVAVNRLRGDILYGPDIAHLASWIVANTLLYRTLTDDPR
ncbi:hypothetical protein [Luteimicrobium subarcticum]|uniref:Uncharacterized protein n=1 Tax=Luteimicrobium subarcticum TaxID=620910 RepID=A0A2M8WJD5_9MICO|nr:hypothetical protein [Luteimicrobium subarcticum]PJI91041.1 hypothetical protein CLV34_2300 [Luteimicrobium subarcticum]